MLYFFIHVKHEKWSDFWRPNTGRPLRMVKGYAVTFWGGTLLRTDVFDMQLQSPNEAWVSYVKWHEVQSLILVVLSRTYVSTASFLHSLPSVPFMNIAFNSHSFFIPWLYSWPQSANLWSSHIFFPRIPRIIYSFTVE